MPEEVWTNVINGEDGDTRHTPPGSILLTCSLMPGKQCWAVLLEMDKDPVETWMREEGQGSVCGAVWPADGDVGVCGGGGKAAQGIVVRFG